MRYRLTCDGVLLLRHQDPEEIQIAASVHACSLVPLDWQYDPDQPTVTEAEYRGRLYRVEIIPIEERGPEAGV